MTMTFGHSVASSRTAKRSAIIMAKPHIGLAWERLCALCLCGAFWAAIAAATTVAMHHH